jgi:hypothetical protein
MPRHPDRQLERLSQREIWAMLGAGGEPAPDATAGNGVSTATAGADQ